MKIMFVAPSNSVHAQRWISQASDSGITTSLVDLVEGATFPEGIGLTAHFTQKAGGRSFEKVPLFGELISVFRYYRLIKAAAGEFLPDIIHCHWLFHGMPYATSFIKGIPIVVTPWGSDLQQPLRPLRHRARKVLANRILTRRIVQKSDASCCDSEKLREILQKRGAKHTPKIIYFGTDVEKFSKNNRDQALRRKFGAGEETILVISNRSHESVYDIPTLIKAAFLLKDANLDIRFVIAGSGSLTLNLKNLVEEMNLADKFYFTGKLNDHDFLRATASCDLYVSTSTSDGGLAASTAEAMACEIPVVITNFGENSDWLGDESAGLLFEIGDHEMLAQQILVLSKSPEMRRSMGAAGRKKISEENNSAVEWGKVLDLYKSLTR